MATNSKSTIAVVAMSGVFPKATGINQFWHNIIASRDTAVEISDERLKGLSCAMVHSTPAPDKAYSKRAGLILEFDFSSDGLDLDPNTLVELDALHQWVLHASRDALKQCRMERLDRNRIGTILAAIALPTAHSSRWSQNLMASAFLSTTATAPALPSFANRVVSSPAALVAQALGLGGGSYTLDAACASSLYAVNLACDQLQSFHADAMITGGVSGADTLYTQVGFSQLKALSRSGRCAPFDQAADGLMVGEGAGILVLKRLDDAVRDQDTIYGVIRGLGWSNDMRGNLLAPESAGQLRAMRSAYTQAGWQPQDVDYIECHGAGTPVGDAVEIDSLIELWKNGQFSPGQCAIGSIKSMVGHLLTGAGAAGMIKTLLALYHQTLPPSLNFSHASAVSPLNGSPFRVQTQPAPWTVRGPDIPRRAAVSAFGFGGINAHVLFEEWSNEFNQFPPQKQITLSTDDADTRSISTHRRTSVVSEPIAIVGMALYLGTLTSLEAFQEAVLHGRSSMAPPPVQRWKFPDLIRQLTGLDSIKGGFVDQLVLEPGEFQIPPSEIKDILPQQLMMLKVAAVAMGDAGLPLRQARERMGTVIGIGFDYEATNFHLRWMLPKLVRQWAEQDLIRLNPAQLTQWMKKAVDHCAQALTPSRTLGALGGIVASRIAREFKFGAPSFVVSAEEASGMRALEIGMRQLQTGECEAMLVGAVDLNCDERNLSTLFPHLKLSANGRIRPFDCEADGTLPGEGAVALVLKRLTEAEKCGDRIYAVLEGTGAAGGLHAKDPMACASAYRRSMQNALDDARRSAADLSLVETHGSGIPHQDALEYQALSAFFSSEQAIALGAVKPVTGHCGAVSGLVSVAKTALTLFHHLLAPLPGFSASGQNQWPDRFYFPNRPLYWARNRSEGPRVACVATMTFDGNCMHLVMRQADEPPAQGSASTKKVDAQRQHPLGALPQALFALHGETLNDLSVALDRLTALATLNLESTSANSVEQVARHWYQDSPALGQSGHFLAIVAQSAPELTLFLSQARRAVDTHSRQTLNGRGGVGYLPGLVQTLGNSQAQLALIYPGSGNHYVGMGRTLAAHWPEVLRHMDARSDHLESQLLPQWYDPRRTNWSSGWPSESYQALAADPLRAIFGQVLFGSQMTDLLHRFALKADAVIGYSLGESAGLFAMGAWPDRDLMLRRLADSDLFKTQLAGPCEAVRRAWQLPADDLVQWRVAVVNRPVGQVDQAIARLAHVRRLIINTPDQCVIGGLAEQVAAAIAALQCEAYYLDGVVTVHCDAAQPVAQAYWDLHRLETTAITGVRFYSGAKAAAYELSAEAAAESIVRQALDGFDFPRTIRTAYKDGVRLFVEVGPHGSCTRMIGDILADKPHLAVAANSRNEDECLSLLKCLGTLIAAGRPIDLAPLYADGRLSLAQGRTPSAQAISVAVGGAPFPLPPVPTDPNQRLAPTSDWFETPVEPIGNQTGFNTELPRLSIPSTQIPELEQMLAELNANVAATTKAHEQFLALSQEMTHNFAQTFEFHNRLLEELLTIENSSPLPVSTPMVAATPRPLKNQEPRVAFDRKQCLEFAIGSVGKVLGPQFEVVDTYKTRVRLPNEPLMLVDRILRVEGQKCGLGSGRVVTEHDVLPNAWYLDGGRAPVCISVEAGQADLFLSSYLGIDHRVQGQRSYRLLDAKIVFHRSLPQPGETIRYDIHIDKFVRQGPTYLFFFRYEGSIADEPLITMTDGCAGFFTDQEVHDSGGILLTDEDQAPGATLKDRRPYQPFLDMPEEQTYDDAQIEALRLGDAARCFGSDFAGIDLGPSLRLPGGRMRLIDRIVSLQPRGGRFGLGYVKAEADIHPDDWFLTCHFVDDPVMPGTLMYECCAHTLRVLLLRMGWVTDRPNLCYEPVPTVACRLKCRGPVTPHTRKVHYAVEIKEIGYAPEPYVIVDAHMYADGYYIVFFKDMSMRMSGISADDLSAFWQSRLTKAPLPKVDTRPAPLFDRSHIHEFAVGRPSRAFGDPYQPFDAQRKIARLPGPPYCFIDRITTIDHPAWQLKSGGWVEAQYEVPVDAWYFAADRSGTMPFCVLLEIALQPCGWLAAYAGSALKSHKDLKFRNLGGQSTLHANIRPADQTLTMRTRLTKVSEAADMILEDFDFQVLAAGRPVYSGHTNFGFFTHQALANQIGLRQAAFSLDDAILGGAVRQALVDEPPLCPDEVIPGQRFEHFGLTLPAKALRMIDTIEVFDAQAGPNSLGFVRGSKQVDPEEWFFKAHFFEDPVCPGSLGIEAFLQLIKYAAMARWPQLVDTHRFELVTDHPHRWQYRGQVIPTNQTVLVEAVITKIQDGSSPLILADGWLHVDGLCIYKMESFGFRLMPIV